MWRVRRLVVGRLSRRGVETALADRRGAADSGSHAALAARRTARARHGRGAGNRRQRYGRRDRHGPRRAADEWRRRWRRPRERLRDGSAGPIVHLPERSVDHDDVGRRAIRYRTSTDAIVTLGAIDDARFQRQPLIESSDTRHVAVSDAIRVRQSVMHVAIAG